MKEDEFCCFVFLDIFRFKFQSLPSGYIHSEEEKLLFQQLLHDDEAAYTQLFHLFTPRLYPYLLKITKDEALAKELLQETFCKLWENRFSLAEVDQPASWLFRIAANTSLSHLRTVANRYRLQQNLAAPETMTDNEVISRMEQQEISQAIQRAVDALPPKRQQIYKLSREQGLTHQQIADQLKLSLQTVKNQIGIALKFIQEFLHKELDILLIIMAATTSF